MSRVAIEARVTAILVEHLGVAESEVRPDVRLQPKPDADDGHAGLRPRHVHGEDLDADSLDIVELVMAVEEEFGVEVPDEEAEAIVTVKDLVDKVEAKLETA